MIFFLSLLCSVKSENYEYKYVNENLDYFEDTPEDNEEQFYSVDMDENGNNDSYYLILDESNDYDNYI